MVNIIILAGEQAIKGLEDSGNKALYKINGKMMIEYVIDAVKMSSKVKKVIVIGPHDKLERHLSGKVDAVIDSRGTVMDSLAAGIEYLNRGNTGENILICSCDMPFITTEAIDDFISRAERLDVDLCYPIVEKSLNLSKYPDMKRTYLKMKEGSFTGGNVFYMNPGILEKCFVLADRLVEARKNPLKMARILGFTFMIRLITGTLTISAVERKVHRLLGIKAKAVISAYPEIGQDIDKYSDLSAALNYLGRY